VTADLSHVAKAIAASLSFDYVGPVGAGAFKETFEARVGDTRHAVKVFRPNSRTERVRREIDAMLRCDHPNIAKLRRVDVIEVDGTGQCLYLIEEFLSGGTLGVKAEATKGLSIAHTLSVGTSLIDALGHIADHGLVHRDIKLENVMLRGDGVTPVIVDFGVVRALNQTSLTKTWAPRGPGTAFFSPPEQLCNEKPMIDWRADQFSLGVTLSLALFGRHPYQMPTDVDPAAIVDRVAHRSHPLPRPFVDLAESAGVPALCQMVALWPVERFRTPDALSAAWNDQVKE
jgi:serine/threonine protein kinase